MTDLTLSHFENLKNAIHYKCLDDLYDGPYYTSSQKIYATALDLFLKAYNLLALENTPRNETLKSIYSDLLFISHQLNRLDNPDVIWIDIFNQLDPIYQLYDIADFSTALKTACI